MIKRVLKAVQGRGAEFAFIASTLAVVFVAGMLIGDLRLFPYNRLQAAWYQLDDLSRYWRHELMIRPDRSLEPAVYTADEYRHEPARAWPGVTLVTGFLPEAIGIKLVAMDGTVMHQWPIRFSEIWPDAAHLDQPVGAWYGEISGALLTPDGDVVFSMYRKGFARIDRCGQVRWRAPARTHHSVAQDDAGTYWVPGERPGVQSFGNQFGHKFTLRNPETIFRFSADGTLIEEYDLVDILYRSGFKGTLFLEPVRHYEAYFGHGQTGNDLTHLNDVEVLRRDLAPAFPMFEAGDLLISLRHRNLIAVLDRETMAVKWSVDNPFLLPHDPDFMADGRISIFDNFGGGDRAEIGQASRILAVDPATGAVETLYQAPRPRDFFTDTRGMHQHLPNGNLLITESNRGRIFEVAPDGAIVWQYVNAWDDQRVIVTYQGERYPPRHADFVHETCP